MTALFGLAAMGRSRAKMLAVLCALNGLIRAKNPFGEDKRFTRLELFWRNKEFRSYFLC